MSEPQATPTSVATGAPFDPIGANAKLGIHPLPIGTLREVREMGMDLDKVACCAPRRPGVRGCLAWQSCAFHMKARGGFKGKGPHNIGYRHRTSKTDGARIHENYTTCYYFVLTLQRRMDKGQMDKLAGTDYELIRIVAQEGEPIVPRRIESVTPGGGPTGRDIRERALPPVPINVPKFLRPNENPGVTYDQKMRLREAEFEALEDELDMNRDEQIRQMMATGAAEGAEALAELNPTLPAPAPGTGLAGPKRSRKAKPDDGSEAVEGLDTLTDEELLVDKGDDPTGVPELDDELDNL